MSKKELNFLNKIKLVSLYGYCLSAGLSIAASQVFVCTNIIAFLFSRPWKTTQNSDIKQLKNAGIIWLIAAGISSLLGVDINHSSMEIVKTLFYFLFPFSVMHSLEIAKPRTAILCLVASQSIAAIHSLISLSFPELSLPNTPGAVTESGQLVLIIPIAFALFYSESKIKNWFEFVLIFISYLLACYLKDYGQITLFIIALFSFYAALKYQNKLESNLLLTLCLALLLGALTVNLKRGPWMAVLFEFALLGFFVSRRLLLVTVTGSLLLFLIGPARERILALGDHFLIYGGRYNMWTLGLEIFARFPLGLGLNNSSYMRIFEPSLPTTHRHMHNNFLNIAVETGVFGLAAYFWIFYCIYLLVKNLRSVENKQTSLLVLCTGISIAGWQVAGTVEYNFGDSEIRLIALFLIGFLFANSKLLSQPKKSTDEI